MTDEKQPEVNMGQPPIIINNQYIKDLSLEIPHAPEIFAKINQKPELKVEMSVQSQKLANGSHNVSLNIALNGDVEGEKLFIILKTGQQSEIPTVRADVLMNLIDSNTIFDIKRTKFLDENLKEV